MPFEVRRRVEEHVVIAHAYGTLTEAELTAGSDAIEGFIKDAIKPLYLVIDANDVELTQSWFNLRVLLDNMSQYRRNAKQVAITLVIANNALVGFTGSMICRTLNVPVRIYRTREEANLYLARQIPEYDALA